MSTTSTVVPIASGPTENKPKPKPTKTLPTDRVNVAKQLDLLRAYAAASNNGSRAVPVQEAADITKMAASTVALCNAFLASISLITRSDAGTYQPSPEVLTFLRAYEWNPETASHKLAPALRLTWFAQALVPALGFAAMDEDAAITKLAEACTAGPDYKKELQALLEFLALGGVITRDGGQIKLIKATTETAAPAPSPAPAPKQEETAKEPTARTPGRNVTTALNSSDGGVTFNVNVAVDMKEFATWRPERISAFFRGIAEVLAAKADVEKSGGNV